MSRTKGRRPDPTIRPRPTYTTADQQAVVDAARRLGMPKVRVRVIRDYSQTIKSIRRRQTRAARQAARRHRASDDLRELAALARTAQSKRPEPVQEKARARSFWRRLTRRGS